MQYRSVCGKCGARRVDQQIGLEATPDEFVARLVEVFREVKRVLHPTGTLWLNLGDSYANFNHAPGGKSNGYVSNHKGAMDGIKPHSGTIPANCKPKDLIGIPWMVAFALRADGWWLRQEIIWHKLAPMPESVTDRCTKAHEQVFLLAKSERYYFDNIAIMEPNSPDYQTPMVARRNPSSKRFDESEPLYATKKGLQNGNPMRWSGQGRNKRSVWTLGPESYSGAHYAVMPGKLVEPCVLSGTSAHGCCSKCGNPYDRVVQEERTNYKSSNYAVTAANGAISGGVGKNFPDTKRTTLGWTATCQCGADVVPAVVLDPFCGSGTTLAVALKFGRRAIGIDLDPRNEILVKQRIEQTQPLLLLEVT